MEKRYRVELDRNERDFATFLKRRKISLSQNELRVLIASKASHDQISLFDTDNFIKSLAVSKSSIVNELTKRTRARIKI